MICSLDGSHRQLAVLQPVRLTMWSLPAQYPEMWATRQDPQRGRSLKPGNAMISLTRSSVRLPAAWVMQRVIVIMRRRVCAQVNATPPPPMVSDVWTSVWMMLRCFHTLVGHLPKVLLMGQKKKKEEMQRKQKVGEINLTLLNQSWKEDRSAKKV